MYLYNYVCILYTLVAKSLACLSVQCPNGSRCKVLNETGETYCEYSCAVDNGGCHEGSQCIEVDVPTCSPGQCCSPVNITCLRMLIMIDNVTCMSACIATINFWLTNNKK